MPVSSYLDTSPELGEGVYLHDTAQVIGDVRIGRDSSVWCNTVLRGDVNRITIGVCSNVQDFAMGHVSHKNPAKPDGSPLKIGNYVTIGHSVILHGCEIGDECLIGMGAGSLVSPGKVLESGYLYVGRPVKRVRKLTEAEITWLKYSAEHYVRVKNNYNK
jgi:carbonic anhydrase/acetyltransferase-like protein (isoleucine patch superfamily)